MFLNSFKNRMEITMDPMGGRRFFAGKTTLKRGRKLLDRALLNTAAISGMTIVLTCIVAGWLLMSCIAKRLKVGASYPYTFDLYHYTNSAFLIPLFIFQRLGLINSHRSQRLSTQLCILLLFFASLLLYAHQL